MLLFIYAPSCVDEEEMARQEEVLLNETRENIRGEFETDYLTETALFAYETTAKQKLSDLSDYLQILMDTELDTSFRVKASEMIKNTFISDNVTVKVAEQNEDPEKGVEIQTLINQGFEDELSTFSFSFDSINLYEPLRRINNTTYSGILRFIQNFTDPTIPEQIIKSSIRYSDFYVVKEGQVFGTDSLKIWKVRLGEIR